jgi:hypothetical protein
VNTGVLRKLSLDDAKEFSYKPESDVTVEEE